jgi:chromosome segregation ATPase
MRNQLKEEIKVKEVEKTDLTKEIVSEREEKEKSLRENVRLEATIENLNKEIENTERKLDILRTKVPFLKHKKIVTSKKAFFLTDSLQPFVEQLTCISGGKQKM